MIINEAGEYTLQYTATDACGNSTTVERDLVVEAPPIYGAVWDGSNNPQWTRTGLASDFVDPQPAVNNGTGSSPFDNIMPWSGMQIVEDADAGTLVSIPKFYYKWIRDGASMELQISMNRLNGFHTSPAHADRGDGVGERDVAYVGRYHCSDVDYKSTSGVLPKSAMTRANFRTNIHALGTDIWQFDFAMYWTIAMLYLVEFAHWNSQAKIGYGCGSGSAKVNEGATDAMQYHTGTNASAFTTYGEIQYRNIEGLWSNVRDFVDGIYFNNTDIYAINNPSEFNDASGGTNIGNRSGGTGTTIQFTNPSSIPNFEYALYPSQTSGSDYTKYVCDHAYYSSAGKVLYIGGAYNYHGEEAGMFCAFGNPNDAYSSAPLGSRLMKLPSA